MIHLGCNVNTVIAEALACAGVTANGNVTVLFALMVDGFPVNTSLRHVILNVNEERDSGFYLPACGTSV